MANKNEMTVSASVANTSPLSYDILIKQGFLNKADIAKAKSAKAAIRADGGYFPETGSDVLAVIANNVLSSVKAAARAGRSASLSLALIDESQEYKNVLNPYGKPFKSTTELFRALFPNVADSTIWNYLNAGKEIYLPAARGTLEPELMILNTLEPGTALSAVGALRDESARKCLPKAIQDVVADKGKLSQSGLKAAVKAAKEAAKVPTHSDETNPTAAKNEKAIHKTAVEELRAALNKLLCPDKTKDEVHLSIDNDAKKDWRALLDNAIKKPDDAVLFVEALKALTL